MAKRDPNKTARNLPIGSRRSAASTRLLQFSFPNTPYAIALPNIAVGVSEIALTPPSCSKL
jgi:hypothetical protein